MSGWELTSVSARYPGRAEALSNVTLSIAPGRVTALLGENGSGKSTLLKVLASVLPACAGEVRLDGRALAGIPRRERARRVAYLPQSFEPLFPATALEIVLLGRTPWLSALGAPTEADRRIARRSLEALDAAALADVDILGMSGGERQRVLLARVLAGEPSGLLLDEPTANLDPRHRGMAVSLARAHVREGRAGSSVVFSTHELDVAAAAADDVVLLAGGRVVAAGSRQDVLTASRLSELFRVRVEEAGGHLALRY